MANLKRLLVVKDGLMVGNGIEPTCVYTECLKDVPPHWIFYCPQFQMHRLAATRHFQNYPLKSFFDGATVIFEGERAPEGKPFDGHIDEDVAHLPDSKCVGPVRYLHGKSLARYGKVNINSVFLLFDEQGLITDEVLQKHMFDLYKHATLIV